MGHDDRDRSGAGHPDPGCAGARNLLPLHFYGLADPKEREALERHLASCGPCAAAWQETRVVLGSVDASTAFPREADVDWSRFAQETVRRAHAAERLPAPLVHEVPSADGSRPFRLRAMFRPAMAWGSLVAVASALLAFTALRVLRPPASEIAGPPVSASPVVSRESARFLQQGLARQGAARYLRDSRALLVDLVQSPVRCLRSDGSLDVALEKERSHALLRRKNLYLDALAGPRDQRLADLMRQLETLLLQVSSLDDCTAARQIHDLRREIERRQILLRIDLIAGEMEGGASRA